MIVAVTGGKGGVGKSTVSLNLARELDAVVVDADLSTADLPRGHGPDLHDVLAGRATPLEAVDSFGSVRVLPCGRTLAGARAANLAALEDVFGRLERSCGRVVVDCPAGLARDVGTQLHSVHAAVLVTTPTESALVDALRTRALARDLETPIAAVVLNRVRTPDDELATRVERRFGAKTTVIEERAAIDEAMAQWRPVRDWHPTSEGTAGFESLARAIERCEKRLSGRVGVL
ncbi:septum site-determining protein MinD [Natronorubrum sediminis]|uniref:Septum site-determining protein MinD n=1 Tax=Natronorubrum sediminis TaxID=640943 RepID=A0A1H6G1P8_9EURY|nr:P-loop NTPase [Natronorubrum sediminis]SEH16979.1 septum site-determining protein MinD [Natronorubrum sediminis]